jgi:nucleoside-triphosphatase
MKHSAGNRIFLTGLPGCGKTTVVRKVADLLRGCASGFYTEEVRDDQGQRIGFGVISLDGKRGELAHKGPGIGPRVGSYLVNVKDFERIALPSLAVEAGRVLLIDEIGKMECCSEKFVRRVEKVFEAEISILATIPLRGGGDFIESIRRRQDAETVLVTRENREVLPEQLAAKLSPLARGKALTMADEERT